MVPNMGLSVFGVVGYNLTFEIQENLYGRINQFAGVTEKLGQFTGLRPDYLTSFTAPLALMQLSQWGALMGQVEAERFNHQGREKMFKMAKFLIPVAVAGLFVAYEISGVHLNGTEYLDNPIADNMATLGALGISMMTALVSEKKRKAT